MLNVQGGLLSPDNNNDSSKLMEAEGTEEGLLSGAEEEEEAEGVEGEEEEEKEEEEEEVDECDGLLTNLLSTVTNLVGQIGPIQLLSKGDINSEQKIDKKGKQSGKSGSKTSSGKGKQEHYGLITDLLNSVSNLLAQVGPLQLLSEGDVHSQQSIELDEE
uniref:Uncharacterized protein n=2 Tax=Rhodnius prolixus TaxID=13249 RepID=T1I9Z6_RHOPR